VMMVMGNTKNFNHIYDSRYRMTVL
jgi:hypothetical protein